MSKQEAKIDPQTAASEFSRWADAWELDADVASMTEEDRTSFESLQRRLTRAISKGSLVVSEDGETLRYALLKPKVTGIEGLACNMPTGRAVLGWDRYKERESIHKLNAFMASMCGTEPAIFSGMDGRDLKVIQAVAQLFLGS